MTDAATPSDRIAALLADYYARSDRSWQVVQTEAQAHDLRRLERALDHHHTVRATWPALRAVAIALLGATAFHELDAAAFDPYRDPVGETDD